jgi:hypothetical protein
VHGIASIEAPGNTDEVRLSNYHLLLHSRLFVGSPI